MILRIPRNFNSRLVNDKTNNLKYIETTDNNNNHDNTYVSELTGETVDKETFKNMPFFGSHIRQSSVGDNNDIVNNHTGNTSFSSQKRHQLHYSNQLRIKIYNMELKIKMMICKKDLYHLDTEKMNYLLNKLK